MDKELLAIITLRATALGLRTQGLHKQADAMEAIARGLEAKRNIDQHMQDVADMLGSGDGITEEQWDDQAKRIDGVTDEFLAETPE